MLILLAGCVSRHDDGTVVSFRYEFWVPLLEFVGGGAAVLAGLAITGRMRWALIIGGFVCAVGFAPTAALTRVWVTTDGFVVRNGIWGMTANADLQFDDIASMREITKQVLGSRAQPRDQLNLSVQLVNGETVQIPVANDVLREASKEISSRFAAQR